MADLPNVTAHMSSESNDDNSAEMKKFRQATAKQLMKESSSAQTAETLVNEFSSLGTTNAQKLFGYGR
jgi:hypothetical protein